MEQTEFNKIKQKFFLMRNGALAEQMRRQGAPYKVIFGLNLPQISQIALEIKPDLRLATQLWQNQSTRESMILATMICPVSSFDEQTAVEWIESCPTSEIADILCLKLLKKTSFADSLTERYIKSKVNLQRYIALRLRLNLLFEKMTDKEFVNTTEQMADKELMNNIPLTLMVCKQIIEEIDYFRN